MRGQEVSRSEEEFRPGPELTVAAALAAYRERAAATEACGPDAAAGRTLPVGRADAICAGCCCT